MTIERIEDLFDVRLGVGATVVQSGDDTVIAFSYEPTSKEAVQKWKELLHQFTESTVVTVKVVPPKRENGKPHYQWTFQQRKPAVVYEVLKRAIPHDSGVVDEGVGHWGFQPKNVSRKTNERCNIEEEI